MKVLLISLAFCVAQVAWAENGLTRHLNGVQPRPLHKPAEHQVTPTIVPVYTPVQQYPPVQYYPAQQYPVQFVPFQPHPQQYPMHQHYQQYPQTLYYPQIYPGMPC